MNIYFFPPLSSAENIVFKVIFMWSLTTKMKMKGDLET